VRPDYLTVTAGQTSVKFECESDRVPTWLFNEGDLPVEAVPIRTRTKKYYLAFAAVMTHLAGTYTCLGEDEGEIYFESQGELVVAGTLTNFFYEQHYIYGQSVIVLDRTV